MKAITNYWVVMDYTDHGWIGIFQKEADAESFLESIPDSKQLLPESHSNAGYLRYGVEYMEHTEIIRRLNWAAQGFKE